MSSPHTHAGFQGRRIAVSRVLLTAILACTFALLAPGPGTVAQPLSGGQSAGEPALLRFHGSNTIGDALMPALVKAFMEEELRYTSVLKASPPWAAKELKDETYYVGRSAGADRWVEIFSHGSATGFEDLLSGKADIWMSSDTITPEQANRLRARFGDLTGPEGEHIIALDGIAVIVNPRNKLPQLTASQLEQIFSGRIRDWKDAGGSPGPIHVYARDENSGTWKFFKKMVLDPAGAPLVSTARRFEQSEELSAAVHRDIFAIGFIGLNYVSGNNALSLATTTDGRALTPNICTVKTEEYFLARRLYLYTSTHPSPMVARFVSYATSRKAWPVVDRVGLVNMDPEPLSEQQKDLCNGPAAPADGRDVDGGHAHSPEYAALTRGHRRLLTNFNFILGKATLDTKADQDLSYLADLLSGPEYAGHRLMLIGYADSSGAFARSMEISVQRANTVNVALGKVLSGRTSVLISLVTGLGAQDFLRPNDNDEDRSKNRRVEVWIN
jgi:phosphate transport system substrate-binding protein